MRIQHNIPAMNAYRNYNGNTKALQANLQKLSSGYKINKAGDDAAGLAISEKMRAQITGLEVAQKNAKDGISLVQTAEGAMTEIHTMLNRMFSLAEQSANGTYDDDVDRQQLQNEFGKLTEEIDRIAQATNFNGKKLLDGELAGGAASGSGTKTPVTLEVDRALKGAVSNTAATALKLESGAFDGTNHGVAANKIGEFNITYKDDAGTLHEVNVQMKGIGTTTEIQYKVGDGDWTKSAKAATAGAITGTDVDDILVEALNKSDLANVFDIANNTTAHKLELKTQNEGETKAGIVTATFNKDKDAGTAGAIAFTPDANEKGTAAYDDIDVTLMKTWSKSSGTGLSNSAADTVFTVDGKKFAFVNNDDDQKAAQAALGDDVTLVKVGTAGAAPAAADATTMAEAIRVKLGYAAATVNGSKLEFKPVEKTGASGGAGAGDGLRLRVGDSTNTYDDITVSIKSLRSADLTGTIQKGWKGEGQKFTLDKLSVAKDSDADLAMGALKDMINYVSTERGNLGATQNRLDHTINNLSTMQENIQDAEATIRDVDVAEEMMKYTKNNILVQSAQAMLAQANQLPQGVLQLLG